MCIYIYVGVVLINILVPRLGLPKQKFLALLLKTTHLKPKSKHHWPNPRIYNQSKTTFSKPSHCDLSLSLSLSLFLPPWSNKPTSKDHATTTTTTTDIGSKAWNETNLHRWWWTWKAYWHQSQGKPLQLNLICISLNLNSHV